MRFTPRARLFGLTLTVVLGAAGAATAQVPTVVAAPVSAPAALPTSAVPAAYHWVGREETVETFLQTAPIERFTDIPVGITKPRRGYFAPGGPVSSFAWKPLPKALHPGGLESYASEIAAYQLSQRLGMHMVPPVVERKINGVKGAAVMWIDNVRPWDVKKPPLSPGPTWSRQTSRMQLFDQLIGNTDRNRGNLLHDDRGHMFLIDHSRAFTVDRTLRRLAAPIQVDRDLWNRIEALTRAQIEDDLGVWLSKDQITALLKRRDEMRKLIEDKVSARGEAFTFLP